MDRRTTRRLTRASALGLAALLVPLAAGAAVYVLHTLGTLGGGFTFSVGLNGAGQVVGLSQTEDGEVHAFLWSPEGGMESLGTLGGSFSYAVDVNNAGQVVGMSALETEEADAFLWSRETGMRRLGELTGIYDGEVIAVNDVGQVLGSRSTQESKSCAYVWSEQSGARDLVEPCGPAMHPVALSEAGQVMGYVATAKEGAQVAFFWSQTDGLVEISSPEVESIQLEALMTGQVVGGGPMAWSGAWHALYWSVDDPRLQDLHPFASDEGESFASLLNDAGQVALWGVDGQGRWRGFLWSRAIGKHVELLTASGDSCLPVALNQAGQVAGYCQLPDGTEQRAFLYDSSTGAMHVLDTVGGSSTALALSGAGLVAGSRVTPEGLTLPFVWHPVTGLRDLAPGRQGYSVNILALNEAGYLLGQWWRWEDGDTQDFVAVPLTSVKAAGRLAEVLGGAFSDGRIAKGPYTALTSSLSAAQAQLESGSTCAARNVLRAFERQLDAFGAAGHVSAKVSLQLSGLASQMAAELSAECAM